MVDHHDLDPLQTFIAPYVIQIVDHHDDNGFDYLSHFPKLGKDGKLDNQRVKCEFVRSSCMSLCLEISFESKIMKEFLDKCLTTEYNYYDLLIDVIVVDSANFDASLKGKKWVDADLKVATFIIDKCKKSIFFSSEKGEDKAYESKDYSAHFEVVKRELIDVKFNEGKNLSLGSEALLCKDRKDFIMKLGSKEEINVSFHSLPLSIKTLWNYEEESKSQNTCQSNFKNFSVKNNLILSVVICRDKGEGLITFYLHDESKLSKKSLENFCSYFNTEKCEGKGKVYEDHGALNFQNKENISRKIVFPSLEKYLSSI